MSWLDEVQDKDNKAVRVSLVASAGSIGGGTEYTEGDVDASITGMAILWEDVGNTLRTVAAASPLPVTVISGGSAGVQYTEGDTDASITGTAILWEDAGDTLRAVSAAKPLPVSGPLTDTQLRATPVPVSGTVTITDGSGPVTVDGTVTVTEPVSVDDNGGSLSIDDGGNVITVDGTVGVSGTVTVDSELPAAAALADDTANPTTPLIGVCAMEFDGSTEANWDRVRHSYYQPLTGLSGAAGPQAEIDMSECPMGDFTVQEFKTGTVSAYNFSLEGSNDGGANWFLILNNTSASGNDSTVSTTATNRRAARRFRINVTSITGAGSISIHTLACPG